MASAPRSGWHSAITCRLGQRRGDREANRSGSPSVREGTQGGADSSWERLCPVAEAGFEHVEEEMVVVSIWSRSSTEFRPGDPAAFQFCPLCRRRHQGKNRCAPGNQETRERRGCRKGLCFPLVHLSAQVVCLGWASRRSPSGSPSLPPPHPLIYTAFPSPSPTRVLAALWEESGREGLKVAGEAAADSLGLSDCFSRGL